MNKNTILAILLILITITLFNTEQYNKFFYENIYPRKPYSTKINEQKKIINEQSIAKEKDSTKIAEQAKNDTISKFQEAKKDSEITENQIIKTDTIKIETDLLSIGISEKGANIVYAKMKKFDYNYDKNKERKKGDFIDLLPEGKSGAQLTIKGDDLNNKIFNYEGNEKEIEIKNNDQKEISFSYKIDNQIIRKTFVIKNGSYQIGLKVSKDNLSGQKIEIGWNGGIEESEISKAIQQDIRTVHYSDGKNVFHLQMKKEDNESITGNYKWVGITSKYFFISIVNDTINDADINITSFKQVEDSLNKKSNPINYSINYSTVANNNTENFWFYIGPNNYKELKQYKIGFEKILFPVLGWPKYFFFADKWFPWLCEAVLWLLIVLYSFVRDYGITIILLTLLTKIVTFPMTHSSMKSMNRMREIQPKISNIREKHKNNPRKMNEEIMGLYKKEGINPLNPGCLPMFLQMPIFFALFVVLRKAIELRGAHTILIPWVHDLSKPEVLVHLPWNIPLYGQNLAILPIIMAILTFFQNKMTIKDPNQKAMIYFMPIFMLVLFNQFSSGLVLYWTLSSAFAIIQQMITDRTIKKSI